MNMIIDIAFIVFATAFVWKLRSISKLLDLHKAAIIEMNENIKIIDSNYDELRDDLEITMKNPQAARRLLKEREQ